MDYQLLTKLEAAEVFLREKFSVHKRIVIRAAQAEARERGISAKTLARASKNLGVREIHNGPHPGFWELP